MVLPRPLEVVLHEPEVPVRLGGDVRIDARVPSGLLLLRLQGDDGEPGVRVLLDGVHLAVARRLHVVEPLELVPEVGAEVGRGPTPRLRVHPGHVAHRLDVLGQHTHGAVGVLDPVLVALVGPLTGLAQRPRDVEDGVHVRPHGPRLLHLDVQLVVDVLLDLLRQRQAEHLDEPGVERTALLVVVLLDLLDVVLLEHHGDVDHRGHGIRQRGVLVDDLVELLQLLHAHELDDALGPVRRTVGEHLVRPILGPAVVAPLATVVGLADGDQVALLVHHAPTDDDVVVDRVLPVGDDVEHLFQVHVAVVGQGRQDVLHHLDAGRALDVGALDVVVVLHVDVLQVDALDEPIGVDVTVLAAGVVVVHAELGAGLDEGLVRDAALLVEDVAVHGVVVLLVGLADDGVDRGLVDDDAGLGHDDSTVQCCCTQFPDLSGRLFYLQHCKFTTVGLLPSITILASLAQGLMRLADLRCQPTAIPSLVVD